MATLGTRRRARPARRGMIEAGPAERYLDRTLPDAAPGPLPPDEIYRDLRLPAGVDAPRRPYTIINMVSTADGKVVVGGSGSTGLIGSATDHMLMRRLMMGTDGELFGAQLIREDNPAYPRLSESERVDRVARGLRPEPLWVIVTTSAEFAPDTKALDAGREHVAVFATNRVGPERAKALEQRVHLYVSAGTVVDFVEMGRVQRDELGVNRLNCLGGPSLNASLIAEHAADELFLTLAPKLSGGRKPVTAVEGTGWPAHEMPSLELLSLYGHGSELYLRYKLPPASTT